MSRHPEALATVRLLGLPLDIYARVQEAHEGLMREFTLIALSEPGRTVPARLVALTEDLRKRYAHFGQEADEQRVVAAARGESTVDLVYEVPGEVAVAAAEYDALLDEAVGYCRHGALLTPAPSDEHIAFRRWFLGEFGRQLHGDAAMPWSQYRSTIDRSPSSAREG